MTSLDRFMELVVIAFFLFAGVTKIFSYRRKSSFLNSTSIAADEIPSKAAYPYWCDLPARPL